MVVGISGSLIWQQKKKKTLMALIFNPCGEFRWSGGPSQIHSPHLHARDPEIFSDLLRSVQMLKRESGVRKATAPIHP